MNTKAKNILIIRFSAMGDVVLTVPVIKSLLNQNPELEITVLTRPFFQTFFENIPQVSCFMVDLKGKHKGIFGLYKLVKELIKSQKIDAVIDLHSVLRTWMIGFFFRLKGIDVFRIDKGRNEKKKFVQKKDRLPLKHTTERYREVFERAGFDFQIEKEFLNVFELRKENRKVIKIGIAPFAAHPSKQWGLDKIYELIETIDLKTKVEIYLFGGGKVEVESLEKMAAYYDHVFNLAGTMTLKEEIQKISEMSAFLSMDSGNMHIATLTGIPVISIWGGTHPDVGFSALHQSVENSIQISVADLPCRPCSVFGTSTCALAEKPFACMRELEVKDVVKRLEAVISIK